MDNELNVVLIDAQKNHVRTEEILSKQIGSWKLNSTLDYLSIEEYTSIFFLLMDHIGENEFPNIIKQEKSYLKQKLNEILKDNDSMLIELLGTLKLYKKLRSLGTCHHVFEKFQENKFNNIDGLWKMFYSLCEELTYIDLEILKQCLPEGINNQIETAEEWFYWALQKHLISKTDFSYLEKIFHNYPNCLDIIKNFERPKSYDIRIPTSVTDCGIAVIFNYETFIGYPKRDGTAVDVNALTDVWNSFGFKTVVHNNLTCQETFAHFKYYADLDHTEYDAFVCCILSHGLPNSVISSDGKEMPISSLIGKITDNCASLNSKPKLFFIQACQGMNIPQGFGEPIINLQNFPEARITPSLGPTPPRSSDVLVAVSSIYGYVSFRHLLTGSWFISSFCNVMKKKGDKYSILEIMTEVNNKVRHMSQYIGPRIRNAQQIVNFLTTFEKILIFKRRIQ